MIRDRETGATWFYRGEVPQWSVLLPLETRARQDLSSEITKLLSLDRCGVTTAAWDPGIRVRRTGRRRKATRQDE